MRNVAGARVEIARLASIAVPLAAAYLAEYAMFLTSKIVVGRLGYRELGAMGLAGDLTLEILVVLMGLLSVVGVLVAQAEGAGDRALAGHGARQGLIVATLLGLPASAVVFNLAPLLAVTGQDPEVVRLAKPYLQAVSASTLPVLYFAVLRSFVSALSRTAVVMAITLGGVALNYLLALGLVHGRFGLPALGVAGAGWATSVVAWLMLLALLVHLRANAAFRGYGLLRGRLRVDRGRCAEIARLGVPVAGLVLLESGLFAAVGLLSGVLGATTLAAYQILMSWVGVPFMVALGVAEATMVRVAYGAARRDRAAARRSGVTGMAAGVAIVGGLVAVPLGLPELIVHLFLDVRDAGFADVAALASGLLGVVAVFQIFDGLQAVASRALRGLRDTVVPLWLAAFGYWVLGIGGGAVLAFPLGLDGLGLWLGLAAGLIVTAALLSWRFFALTARGGSRR